MDSLSHKAYLVIKRIIMDMEVTPQETLTELKLAAKLRMSRTPIREALKKLENENLIISYNKKGYFLNIPSMKDIKEIYEMRMVLEGGAVRLAAPRIDLGALKDLEKKLKLKGVGEYEKTKADDLLKFGKGFHFFILDHCGNERLKEQVKRIYGQLQISRIYSYRTRGNEAVNEHLRIINALKERDAEKSRLCMEEHLRNAFNALTKIL